MSKLAYFWFGVKVLFCTCQPDHRSNGIDKIHAQYKISKIGKLSASVSESSGVVWNNKRKSLFTMNDSGGEPILYEMDSIGNQKAQIKILNAVNRDWEDLATGPDSIIFIGDFGNNGNNRKDLTIYKTDLQQLKSGEIPAEKIEFKYGDQFAFPPVATNRNFDCEAFFYFNEKLYLFSKNRSKENHFVKLYALNATTGTHEAIVQDSISIDTQVTSADISPDGKTFVLLTYGKVLLFEVRDGEINFRNPIGCFRFSHMQSEAIAFINNKDMVATNEQGEVFRITRR